MKRELLTIKRTDTGLDMDMMKFYDIETTELEKIKEWLSETLQEIEEELIDRYNYEEFGDDMEDEEEDVVPEWEICPVWREV